MVTKKNIDQIKNIAQEVHKSLRSGYQGVVVTRLCDSEMIYLSIFNSQNVRKKILT
jgi:hypothetical protein